MRVGYYQFHPRFGEVGANTSLVTRRLEKAEADLIVLPELAFTGYLFRDRAEALALAEDPRRSPTVAALAALCRRRGFRLVTGFAERQGRRVFNSSLLIGPRGVTSIYRKVHLFNEEKLWFDPGGRRFAVRRVGGVGVGMMVCFDWVFPEAARSLALQGMDLLCHPSNLVLGYCQDAMRTRCLENGVFAITANRIGAESRDGRRLEFTGRSQIVGPRGELLHRGPANRSQLFLVDIDPRQAREKHLTPRNHLLRDRRPRFYQRPG